MTDEQNDATADDYQNRGLPNAESSTEGYKPLRAEEQEREFNLFPPDIQPTVEVGGDPEEQHVLQEEMDR